MGETVVDQIAELSQFMCIKMASVRLWIEFYESAAYVTRRSEWATAITSDHMRAVCFEFFLSFSDPLAQGFFVKRLVVQT
ncbi:hypothetical protein RAZWK3B_14574 [Roseobacter sp. AzwK-3b]|nr:hypothetical protein RAZWK3B_14574 [Roseobacter sp. AzwK-3b]